MTVPGRPGPPDCLSRTASQWQTFFLLSCVTKGYLMSKEFDQREVGHSRRAVVRTAAWVTPGILVAAASPAVAASPTTPQPPARRAAPGGYYTGGSRGLTMSAYIDITDCPGSKGTLVSLTQTWSNGQSTTQSPPTNASVTPMGSNQLIVAGTATPSTADLGEITSLTAVINFTAGCSVGAQTFTWKATKTLTGVGTFSL